MGLSYADAVTLLKGHHGRTVAILDRLTGGLLLAAVAVPGLAFAVNLFEPRSELARLSDELVREISQRIHGLNRHTRNERLVAAHSVIVLAAFFEVLASSRLAMLEELELTKAEQVALVAGEAPGSSRLGALANGLLRAEVPMPSPQRPSEFSREDMRAFYHSLAKAVSRFVEGLSTWDRLDETRRAHFTTTLFAELPDRAVVRYDERFRELAVEFPEMAFWANQVDHQATRAEVRHGMADLAQLLTEIKAGRLPDDRRLGLTRAYQVALERPVLTSRDTPPGLKLPLLGDAYVTPNFRATEATGEAARRLSDESWWASQPVRDDLEMFLFGYLMSPQAVHTPLVVLGQPGSGKSVLTQILAAHLPPDQFLVVRVALREVAGDADLQAQIEDGVRSATGEAIAWPDLVRSADGALPLVLLDGFDELLQATGVTQTDYLERVANFQAREAAMRRPAAFLVTSRTAVADRSTPPPGTVVIRLEPFSRTQITQWLEVWNRANAEGFAARDIQPLTVDAVLHHPELASQPLLLIMLALYDADGNRLQQAANVPKTDEPTAMSEAELYERLLVGFAEREVRKAGAYLSVEQFENAVERELLRLSVVAFAMFSRGRQWINETELDSDLPILLGVSSGHAVPSGLRAPLTAAQMVVGRFFFIHEAQATRNNTQLHTYEFLHATFGEYLIARLVMRELADLAVVARFTASRTRPQSVDDTFLHVLLSYMPLTMRGTIVSFVAERLAAMSDPQRRELHGVLLYLFSNALGSRHESRYSNYAPLPLSVPERYAAYSANLVVLAVLSTEQLTGSALFPDARDPVEHWRNLAMLWRSQLPHEGWGGLLDAMALDRGWTIGGRRDVVLRHDKETGQLSGKFDLYWSHNRPESDEARRSGRPFGWSKSNDDRLRRQAWFICDGDDDTAMHALEPFKDKLDGIISSFHSYGPSDDAVSTTSALISLWLASTSDCAPEELATAYEASLEIAIRARFASDINKIRKFFRFLVLRQLARDQHRVPAEWLDSIIQRIRESPTKDSTELYAAEELIRMANDLLPELMAAGQPEPRPSAHVTGTTAQ